MWVEERTHDTRDFDSSCGCYPVIKAMGFFGGEIQTQGRKRGQAGQAVDTTHLTDSVTMLTKEGFELRHEVFLHDAPTEPVEVVEE